MLMLPPTVKIFLSSEPVDMRKSFNGLCAVTREVIRKDPLSGHLFVFINRRKDRCKVLFWDRNGYCLMYKLLEKGTFKRPKDSAELCVEIDAADLALMLEGIDLKHAKRQPRWKPYC